MGTKHTQGPWKAEGWENTVVNAENGDTIVVIPGASKNAPLAEHKANAALIAAAPDLLEACKLMLEHFAPGAVDCAEWALLGNSQTDAILRATRAAIARAEAPQ